MPRGTVSTLAEIGNERLRQMEVEGWDFVHDDAHTDRSLALVASLYASPITLHEVIIRGGPSATMQVSTHDPWPGSWERRWDKRKKHDERRRLIIAAALLVAEIERLDRAEEKAR